MKRSQCALACVLTGFALTPAFAQNHPADGLIGVFADAAGTHDGPLTLREGDPHLLGHEPIAFRSLVNHASCAGTSCGFVNVESGTWSSLKGFYR